MSSSNNFTRPPGSISIPVEIISLSTANPSQRPTSSFRPYFNDDHFHEVSHSPPWKEPSTTSNLTGRFLPRQSPAPNYERVIRKSHFNQPIYDQEPSFQPSLYERGTLHPSRSTGDFFSSSTDTLHPNTRSRNSTYFSPLHNSGFRQDSDFVDLNKHMDAIRRSHEALFDGFPDAHQNFPTNRPYPFEQQQSDYRPSFVNSNKDREPNDHQQPIYNAYDRSHSPASQRDESPARPAPPTSHQQPESDFKVTKDAASSMPKANTTATSSQSNDQQVPSADVLPVRDPNAVALEKLEQINQHLSDLNERVDTFTGSTRDDRLYKLLDEQAVKMMMCCDELTNVSADIKEKRKQMIRDVQTVLAKLESKVPINPIVESNSTEMETALIVLEPSESHEESPST